MKTRSVLAAHPSLRSAQRRQLGLRSLVGFAASMVVVAVGAGEQPQGDGKAEPPPGKASEQTYRVRWLPGAKIVLDGRANEPAWAEAAVDKRFVFPWKQTPAPETEFRALCDGTNFYFTFRVQDADIVVLDQLRDEEDEVFEDRVEVYLSRDEQMKDYFCFEVDSRGRVFDYRGSYYRQSGYEVEVRGAGNQGRAAAQGLRDRGAHPAEEPGGAGISGFATGSEDPLRPVSGRIQP